MRKHQRGFRKRWDLSSESTSGDGIEYMELVWGRRAPLPGKGCTQGSNVQPGWWPGSDTGLSLPGLSTASRCPGNNSSPSQEVCDTEIRPVMGQSSCRGRDGHWTCPTPLTRSAWEVTRGTLVLKSRRLQTLEDELEGRESRDCQ